MKSYECPVLTFFLYPVEDIVRTSYAVEDDFDDFYE